MVIGELGVEVTPIGSSPTDTLTAEGIRWTPPPRVARFRNVHGDGDKHRLRRDTEREIK